MFLFRFSIAQESEAHDVLLAYTHASEFDCTRFSSLLENHINQNLAPDEVLIVVPQPFRKAVQSVISEDDELALLFSRFNRRTEVRIASFGINGALGNVARISGPDRSADLVDASLLARRAITQAFKAHGGFVHSKSTYHFVNPSGRHTRQFIRLSNLMANTSEIAFFAFACLPYISDEIKELYVDTPILLSVASALNDIRACFGKKPLYAENFRSYEGLKDFGIRGRDTSFALVSASSSGGLARDLVGKCGFNKANILHMLFLGKEDPAFNVVCNLRRDDKDNPDGIVDIPEVFSGDSCLLCDQGSFRVFLNGDQFDIGGPQPNPVLLLKDSAPNSLASTIKRIAGKGALRVKVGTGASQQGYFIDLEKIIGDPGFVKALNYGLRRAVPASVTHVLKADDSAASAKLAQTIQKFVQDCAGRAPEIVECGEIDKVSGEDLSILVVAPVIESGRVLTDVSRDLRSVAASAPITYLVGFEKTTGMPQRVSLKNTLIQCPHSVKHEYVQIEHLVLPASSGKSAWHVELEFLQRMLLAGKLSDPTQLLFNSRISQLCGKGSSEGLSDELFLPTVDGSQLELHPGFVFWNGLPPQGYDQSDVFFTIASVLQQLRVNAENVHSKTALRSAWYHQSVLAPENFARFNDDIIQASLLRAANPAELNYLESPDESRTLGRIIRRIVLASTKSRGGAALEFLLALATKRIKLLSPDIREVVSATQLGGPLLRDFGNFVQLEK